MDKDFIKRKCRKVFINVTNNKIFDYGSGEYDFVSAFRDQQKAQTTLDSKNEITYEFDRHKIKLPIKVMGFYLVPEKLIE